MADVERIKAESDWLAGDLAAELADRSSDGVSKDATQLIKFHGMYQQDDRDVRRERLQAGLGKAITMMVRASIPGGVTTAEQYLACDRLADEVADGTLRITTRQGLQWHKVGKFDVKQLIRTLNASELTTIAACGDVSRNVMACTAPLPDRDDLTPWARDLARAVRPRTRSYWDLWLDGERSVSAVEEASDDPDDLDPLYGPTYLPRKFKIGFAHTGDNCVDAYTNDVGIVPVRDDAGGIVAFTLLVGGGLGMTHNKPATFPRLADPLGDVAPERLTDAVKAIITVQRDHGDRTDRKHARMKYLVEEWGVERFRATVEERLPFRFDPPSAPVWDRTSDHLGWHEQADGALFLGVHVPSGRIQDTDGVRLRTAIREVVTTHGLGVRFTAAQNLLLCDVPVDARGAVEATLRAHGVTLTGDLPTVTRKALACPALPTCGLALAEAERAMPDFLADLDARMDALGIDGDAPQIRVTGCPNGCARPYSTEIGVVGRGKDHYTVHLGGDDVGTRLNEVFADRVGLAQVGELLEPVLTAWYAERDGGETFGDWTDRVGVTALRARFDAARFEHQRQPAAARKARS
ncbi:NADPH-dependent assimilatory sulfite reductase hemoprotein subunit [Egicoccus halophilus]|uniref:assimilatory sulfite reductase (ferredoxin) n=1 Tax=Egicoccus halophilus TaxID=1670830 RepID=A0A8J3A7G8_9ACTN|nr:NADPH-dependent assimilatory sulfite reductase hemoprotein subunit [Egicoccus halophilus]GGI02653.1 sulfite reductase subunit beta [Egicoccus halophilus]